MNNENRDIFFEYCFVVQYTLIKPKVPGVEEDEDLPEEPV